ncbi:hypothetical protein ACIOC1_21955 [Streptomyces sp. NPDC088197]|uniref:hypothetical protein n=1 Tax=Streptomyces sp. NPDC088197 TaxID=3365840 RepID=UPI00382EB621
MSAAIYGVREPVHWLLEQVDSAFMQRQIAREVGRQLRTGTDPERLAARLRARFAAAVPADIREPGRWLLGVALPRWGCGLEDCEAGVLWSTGARCEVCASIVADRRRPAASRRACARTTAPPQIGPGPVRAARTTVSRAMPCRVSRAGWTPGRAAPAATAVRGSS